MFRTPPPLPPADRVTSKCHSRRELPLAIITGVPGIIFTHLQLEVTLRCRPRASAPRHGHRCRHARLALHDAPQAAAVNAEGQHDLLGRNRRRLHPGKQCVGHRRPIVPAVSIKCRHRLHNVKAQAGTMGGGGGGYPRSSCTTGKVQTPKEEEKSVVDTSDRSTDNISILIHL